MAPKEEFKAKSNSKSVMNAPKGGKVSDKPRPPPLAAPPPPATTQDAHRYPRAACTAASTLSWRRSVLFSTLLCMHAQALQHTQAAPINRSHPTHPPTTPPQAKDAKRAEAKAKKLEKAGHGVPTNLTKK